MKALSIFAVAIFLGFTGAAMAGDSGENHQDNTNATGPNPHTSFSDRGFRPGAYQAFGQSQHHAVKPQVKK
jgi:hypothetical protein